MNNIIEIINNKAKEYDFNNPIDYIKNIDDLTTLENPEDIRDFLQNLQDEYREITDSEVIYYYDAMKYLLENDQSLNESIDLAIDMGYELKNINSCILASLLQSQENEQNYQIFINEVIEEITK